MRGHQKNNTECQPPFKCRFCLKRFTNCEDRMTHESTEHDMKWYLFDGKRYPDYNAIFDPFNSKKNEVTKGVTTQVEFTTTKEALNHEGSTENQLVRSAHLSSGRIEGSPTAATIPTSLPASVQTSSPEESVGIQKEEPRPHIPQKISQIFPCIFCPCMSRGRDRFEIHMRQHTMETPFSCRFCGQCFVSRGTHARHENRHSEDGIEKSFLCSVCPKQLKTKISLGRHLRTHNSEGKAKCDPEHSFLCKFCGKSCTSRAKLWRHEKVHSDERPYKCPHCEKSFQQSACLVRHAVVHTGKKPYKCTSCEKTFGDPSNRRVHERQIHNKVFRLGEKMYNCRFCGKRFASQTQLNRHERVHSGERPFGCGLCEKGFKRKSHLEAHQVLHTRTTKKES